MSDEQEIPRLKKDDFKLMRLPPRFLIEDSFPVNPSFQLDEGLLSEAMRVNAEKITPKIQLTPEATANYNKHVTGSCTEGCIYCEYEI